VTAVEAKAVGASVGGVVVLHEVWGLTPYITSVCDALAAAGLDAVAPELFTDRDEIPGLGDDAFLMAIDGALDALRPRHPEGRLAVLGFCFGGRLALLAAGHRALGAAVSFYPTGVATAEDLRTPWLGMFGGQDPIVPAADVDALESAVAGAAVPTQVVRYPSAGHAFHNHTRPDRYDAGAAADAWERAVAWLTQRRDPS
jgi:carboxymethylenebutenolidase